MGAPAAPVLWEVVEEHLEEAAFLYGHWERGLASPGLSLAALAAGFEERLLGHIDGLVAAGAAAQERLLGPALDGADPRAVTAAALAWLATPGRAALERVLQRLDGPDARRGAAVVRALELARRPGLDGELVALAAGGEPRRASAALTAAAFRRIPMPAEVLTRMAASRAPGDQAAALRAARLAGSRAQALAEWGLRAPDPAVRDAAIETGLALGLRAAWTACQRAVEAGAPDASLPLRVLAMSGEPSDLERLLRAAASEALRPGALVALGYSGRAAAAEACLGCMEDVAVARVAGEAFSAITGLAISGEHRAPEPAPPEEPVPFDQEDLGADLVPPPEAELPLPAPRAVAAWWKGAKGRFDPGQRYVGGEPLDAGGFRNALAQAPMRRCPGLALELAARTRGEVVLQPRGWAGDQLQELRRPPSRVDLLPFGKLLRP